MVYKFQKDEIQQTIKIQYFLIENGLFDEWSEWLHQLVMFDDDMLKTEMESNNTDSVIRIQRRSR